MTPCIWTSASRVRLADTRTGDHGGRHDLLGLPRRRPHLDDERHAHVVLVLRSSIWCFDRAPYPVAERRPGVLFDVSTSRLKSFLPNLFAAGWGWGLRRKVVLCLPSEASCCIMVGLLEEIPVWPDHAGSPLPEPVLLCPLPPGPPASSSEISTYSTKSQILVTNTAFKLGLVSSKNMVCHPSF